MPTRGPVPWDCIDHTVAKHDIYKRYLERWFPILLSGKERPYPSVTYAEGFAGPGVYTDGEEGSPVIAIRALLDNVPTEKGIAKFAFVDDDPRCVAMLNATLRSKFPDRPRPASTMPVEIKEGTCSDKLEEVLDRLGSWGQPIFANLDSWGNAPVPYKLLQRLAANVSTEVMITLLPQHFVRFVGDMGSAGDEVFGGDSRWRTVTALDPASKSRHILTCYRDALESAGFSHLLDFELVPRNGQPLYLIFATSHKLGVQKMKDSLWEVDRANGIGFRDPRDEQAEALFSVDEPQLGPLVRLVKTELRRRGQARVEELRQFALLETVFRPEHVIRALQPLVDSGEVEASPTRRLNRSSLVRLAMKPDE